MIRVYSRFAAIPNALRNYRYHRRPCLWGHWFPYFMVLAASGRECLLRKYAVPQAAPPVRTGFSHLIRAIGVGLLIALLIAPLSPAIAVAAENGTIEGKVVNRTAGGPVVSDLKVTLKGYVNGAEKSSKDATTGKAGQFVFNGVNPDSSIVYVISTNYQEADYNSAEITFGKGETTKIVELYVWEATADGSAVTVQAAHMVFYLDEGGLRVEEYIKVSNNSDRAYVGSEVVPGVGRKRTLTFVLPENATGLQTIDGLMDCCIQKTADGFYDTMAVPPDKGRDLVFGYMIDYGASSYTVNKPVNLPTNAFNVFVPEAGGIQLQSDQLKLKGPISGGGGAKYNVYVAEQLRPGASVAFTLSGLPNRTKVNLKLISVISGILVLGLAVSYPIFKRRKLAPVRMAPSPLAERESLVAEIARLDDDFEAGRIKEQYYRRVRAQKKARLIELSRNIKK